jgi:ABC-type branched-subunit amino acid transport system substrate-binding protein
VWAVAAGLLIGGVLLYHVVSNAISTLSDDIRNRLRASVRSNARPLAVSAVVLVWTLAYGLYSVAVQPVTTLQSNLAGRAPSESSSGSEPAAVEDVATGPVEDAAAAGSPAGRTTSARRTTAARSATSAASGAPTVPIKAVSLYSGAQDVLGMTSTVVKICGHAPLIFGQILNTKPEDLLVYWRYLNDHGGINGRTFDVSLEDDQYTAEGGVPAAQKCAERNPFLIFGALGSDVIPPVRLWAEQNKQLYLYGFTVRAGSERLRYSYSTAIQQEEMSVVLANVAADRLPGRKAGIVWRNSSNFQPGRDAFKRQIAKRGGQIVADIPVTKSQGNYTQEVIQLQQSGAEVVFMLDDAVGQLNMIKQAKAQRYNPQWLIFSFNIQTQTLGDDAVNPPLLGTNLAPAYECHRYDGPYASYADEIKEFEAAYAKYSPNTDLCGVAGDVAFQGWVGFKALASLFQVCGRDCTRNRLAGVLEAGYKARVGASCLIDFSVDPHHGGWEVDLMEAYRVSGDRVGWRNAERCLKAS